MAVVGGVPTAALTGVQVRVWVGGGGTHAITHDCQCTPHPATRSHLPVSALLLMLTSLSSDSLDQLLGRDPADTVRVVGCNQWDRTVARDNQDTNVNQRARTLVAVSSLTTPPLHTITCQVALVEPHGLQVDQ